MVVKGAGWVPGWGAETAWAGVDCRSADSEACSDSQPPTVIVRAATDIAILALLIASRSARFPAMPVYPLSPFVRTYNSRLETGPEGMVKQRSAPHA